MEEVLRRFGRWISQFFSWFSSGLETTKLATKTLESSQKLLYQIKRGENEPEDDLPEIEPDFAAVRVHATADLLKSYALFGFLEFFTWVVKVLLAYLLIAQCLKWMRSRNSRQQ